MFAIFTCSPLTGTAESHTVAKIVLFNYCICQVIKSVQVNCKSHYLGGKRVISRRADGP